MKKLILILISVILLNSCKTSKASCDAYGKINHDNNTLSSDSVSEHLKSH
jgi:hypothetical protein